MPPRPAAPPDAPRRDAMHDRSVGEVAVALRGWADSAESRPLIFVAADERRVAKKAEDSGYPPSLEVLVEGAKDARSTKEETKIYFLRRIPRDPFNDDSSLSAAETWGKRSYKSPPDAPEAGEDVFDVYSLSEQVGINGIPYKEW